MTAIARAFETKAQAEEAIQQLLAAGLTSDRIQMVAPDIDGTPAAGLRAGKALSRHGDTEAYALALEKGQTLVIAESHFGSGMAMSAIMDACHPVTLDIVTEDEGSYHRGTPLSFAFGLPVLIRNNPAPLSRYLGISTEPRKRSFLGKWFGGELTASGSPTIKMAALSTGGNTLSSKLRIPELQREEMGDSSFGMPLKNSNAAPMSSKLGLPLLWKSPAPLSKMFGLAVLTRTNDKTPGAPPPPSI